MLDSNQKSQIKQNKSLQENELEHWKTGKISEEEADVILKSFKYRSSL